MPTAPIVSNEWSTGETRAIKDNQTGDLLVFRGTDSGSGSSGSKFNLAGSRDNGATWQTIATNVSNPATGGFQWPSRIVAVAQDSSGLVHALTAGTDGDGRFFYQRFALQRTAGHVTAFSLSTSAPIALPNHNRNNSADIRGDIGVYRLNGAEVVVWAYDTAMSSDLKDVRVYAGRSTHLLPAASSDFLMLDGSAAGDTLLFQNTSSVSPCMLCNHYTEALIAQNEASEDLYMFLGQLNSDHAVGLGTNAELNLRAIRLGKSSSGWTIGATTTIATAGSVAPQLIDVDSASDRAWVMYVHPTNGISYGYFNASGTYVSGPASTGTAATAGRAAFGAFTAGDNGRLWSIWHLYGYLGSPKAGGASYWNGTSWTNFSDSGVRDANGIASVQGWSDGVAAIRFDGELLPQNQVAPSVSTLYGQ